jgi:hypothetical protein
VLLLLMLLLVLISPCILVKMKTNFSLVAIEAHVARQKCCRRPRV